MQWEERSTTIAMWNDAVTVVLTCISDKCGILLDSTSVALCLTTYMLWYSMVAILIMHQQL